MTLKLTELQKRLCNALQDGLPISARPFADLARSLGADERAPYELAWNEAPPGCYDVTAVAIDDAGEKTRSNTVRMTVGLVDLARGKAVVASSGESPETAVDGDYFTCWSAEKRDDAWLHVDLGAVRKIDRVNLLWGWKIHPCAFTIDVARANPDKAGSWATVRGVTGRPYVIWEATDRVRFQPVEARYVRVSATKRAGRQTWAGYRLMALEVPVKAP